MNVNTSSLPFTVARSGIGAVDARWMKPHGPLHLGADGVHVWRVNVHRVARCALPLVVVLSEDERVRSESLFFAADRSRFMVAHASLRIILGGYLNEAAADLAFVHGSHGKPALADRFAQAGIEFSLAHSGDWAVCAFARRRAVGIDIERRRAVAEAAGIAAWSLSTDERKALASARALRSVDTFFDLWTRKEARIKAAGQGLFASLAADAASFTANKAGPNSADTDGLTVRSLAVAAGYSAALAIEGSSSDPMLFDCDPHFLLRELSRARGRTAATRSIASSMPRGVRYLTV